MSFIYPIYIHNWRNIITIYLYKILASKEVFSPSNKIHGEVGRAKDLAALLVSFGSPVPLAAPPYDCSFVGVADSNHTGTWKSVSCEGCVLSGRGLCDGPIIRPEESYGV